MRPSVSSGLGAGSAGYVAIAVLIALLGGLVGELSPGVLVAFVLFAAFAAFVPGIEDRATVVSSGESDANLFLRGAMLTP